MPRINKIRNKIKLVIWDLDETYWSGTLSEEGIVYNKQHHNIILELNKRGIVNSICSKNNEEEVFKVLKNNKIFDCFVFPRISWSPKGEVVKSIIEDMQLRDENVLFIDDNLSNLNEVLFYCPGISVAEPIIIKKMLSSKLMLGKKDSKLSRLSQYKILETKLISRKKSDSNNYDFLKSSNIKVSFSNEVMCNIDRIHELVERTNQLNFTKIRLPKEELVCQIEKSQQVGCVHVKDKFGNYGLCGFYLIVNNDLKHFVFSCRVLNMGIESYVYQHLGCPKLTIDGEVTGDVSGDADVSYILNDDSEEQAVESDSRELEGKILIVGGCDLDQVVHYIDSKTIDTEFNYVRGNISVHKEHTELLLGSINKREKLLNTIKDFPVYLAQDINSKIFTTDWDVLVYSPLNDFSRGLYRHKVTGVVLPFDNLNIDWTKSENWNDLPKHLKSLPKSHLESLRDYFDFIGGISSRKFRNNFNLLVSMFSQKKIIIFTGSEVNVLNPVSWDVGMELRHIELNSVLREISDLGAVELVDVGKNISTTDLSDNLRHYKKKVYWSLAEELTDKVGKILSRKITRNTFSNTIIYSKELVKSSLRISYHFVKKIIT